MKLSNSQFSALSDALVGAFDLGELESMVRKQLGKELEDIAKPDAKPPVVEQLIRWCERRNKVQKLCEGACAENSHNEKLQAIKARSEAEKWFVTFEDAILEVLSNEMPLAPKTDISALARYLRKAIEQVELLGTRVHVVPNEKINDSLLVALKGKNLSAEGWIISLESNGEGVNIQEASNSTKYKAYLFVFVK